MRLYITENGMACVITGVKLQDPAEGNVLCIGLRLCVLVRQIVVLAHFPYYLGDVKCLVYKEYSNQMKY